MIKPLVTAILFAMTGAAAAECTIPKTPTLPDGAKATKEQMLDGQKAVKTFQKALFEYRTCLEDEITASKEAAKGASEKDFAAAQDAYNKATKAYNDAVSMEQDIAGQFNTEIREYKAALSK